MDGGSRSEKEMSLNLWNIILPLHIRIYKRIIESTIGCTTVIIILAIGSVLRMWYYKHIYGQTVNDFSVTSLSILVQFIINILCIYFMRHVMADDTIPSDLIKSRKKKVFLNKLTIVSRFNLLVFFLVAISAGCADAKQGNIAIVTGQLFNLTTLIVCFTLDILFGVSEYLKIPINDMIVKLRHLGKDEYSLIDNVYDFDLWSADDDAIDSDVNSSDTNETFRNFFNDQKNIDTTYKANDNNVTRSIHSLYPDVNNHTVTRRSSMKSLHNETMLISPNTPIHHTQLMQQYISLVEFWNKEKYLKNFLFLLLIIFIFFQTLFETFQIYYRNAGVIIVIAKSIFYLIVFSECCWTITRLNAIGARVIHLISYHIVKLSTIGLLSTDKYTYYNNITNSNHNKNIININVNNSSNNNDNNSQGNNNVNNSNNRVDSDIFKTNDNDPLVFLSGLSFVRLEISLCGGIVPKFKNVFAVLFSLFAAISARIFVHIFFHKY
jgi:hypothetical protein